MKARDNPFASERVTALPFVAEAGIATLWQRLEALHWHGAIVGPCGTGKTTLLEATAHHLAGREFRVAQWRLDTRTRCLPRPCWHGAPGPEDALLVDGIEQLSLWEWNRLLWHARRVGAFIVTSHRPTSLPLWLRTATSPALLQQLVRDLGETLSNAEAEALWQQHGGNLRLALWQLYDDSARRGAASHDR